MSQSPFKGPQNPFQKSKLKENKGNHYAKNEASGLNFSEQVLRHEAWILRKNWGVTTEFLCKKGGVTRILATEQHASDPSFFVYRFCSSCRDFWWCLNFAKKEIVENTYNSKMLSLAWQQVSNFISQEYDRDVCADMQYIYCGGNR